MIDYNQPWGWVTGQGKQKNNNMIAPLGASGPEGVPAPVMGEPSLQDKMVQQVGGALANKAVDGAAKGVGEYMNAAPLAATSGDTLVGGVGNAAEMTGNVSEMASAAAPAAAGLQVLGPLGAAMSGAMKGEYDQAAGAALGSALGSTFGPLGTMIGSKLGGYAGNAVGGLFGLADGTTKVPDDKSKGIVQSIWDRMVNSGREAMEKSVKTATGNDGGLGQAKQALVSRKERLDAEERKAMGYAWGTTNAGGKGFPAAAGGTVLNRPWGSTAATGYYGDRAQSSSAAPVTYRPHGFATSQQQQAVPTVQQVQPNVWNAGAVSGGFGGGDSAGEGGGGTGVGGDASSGSGIGNGAEGDASGPGGDAGAGGGGGGGK